MLEPPFEIWLEGFEFPIGIVLLRDLSFNWFSIAGASFEIWLVGIPLNLVLLVTLLFLFGGGRGNQKSLP